MCAFPRKITYSPIPSLFYASKKSEGKTTHECVIIFRRRCSYFSAFSIIIRWPWKITLLLLSLAISLPVVKKPQPSSVCAFFKSPDTLSRHKKGVFYAPLSPPTTTQRKQPCDTQHSFFFSSLFKTLLDTIFTWSTKKQAYRMTAAHSLSKKGDKNKCS